MAAELLGGKNLIVRMHSSEDVIFRFAGVYKIGRDFLNWHNVSKYNRINNNVAFARYVQIVCSQPADIISL
jgi:hypothetical protein